ncbi:hypothetical protein CCACVL1_09665 [Corchorus capsularis]|uniref:F-box domain-containing protein n=1 Tax=Corchorus capsularis TaxID=210143 RepID=A0A1R3IUK7_COCAP|nr:hypothetical protein CCACVL1_09665 [Corchorus capsularis]
MPKLLSCFVNGNEGQRDHVEHILPDKILIKVLSKLSAEQVWKCRMVCKRWFRLISDPYFANKLLYLERSPSIVLGQYLLGYKPNAFFYLDNNNNGRNRNKKTELRKWFAHYHQPTLVASCNGLLLFESSRNYFIGNPITKEIVNLVKPIKSFVRVCGFYFHSSTKEYKLLYVQCEGVIDYYSVISIGSVRGDLRDYNHDVPSPEGSKPVAVKNILYWKADDKFSPPCQHTITGFDTNNEEFFTLPHPSCNAIIKACKSRSRTIHGLMHLLEMEGRLTCWFLGLLFGFVYVLDDDENYRGTRNWTLMHKFNLKQDFKDYPLFKINGVRLDHDIKLLSIQNKELLLVWFYRGVFRYNIVTRTVRKLKGFKNKQRDDVFLTSYTKSVVSLKDLYPDLYSKYKRS